jgi:arabinose-5-phosphate isomerase
MEHLSTQDSEVSSSISEFFKVLSCEADALQFFIRNISRVDITRTLDLLHSVKGHIICSGIGKSGLVARKCSATFASCGIPSFFVHPTEALHGDLGMVTHEDLLLAFSKSAYGAELERVILSLNTRNIPSVLISCQKGRLNTYVTTSLILPFEREACSFNLAPTSSSTLMIVCGDALALSLRLRRNFRPHDYAELHPGGSLGAILTVRIFSLMHTGDALPIVSSKSSFQELVYVMTSKKLGVALVVDAHMNLEGIITDGDLRRACEEGPIIFEKTAGNIMNNNPVLVRSNILAYDALIMMEEKKITSLVVVENEKLKGIIHLHDIMQAGISR